MKERDQTKMDTLRAILSAATNEAVALGKTPQDPLEDGVLQAVIKRLIKQRKDAIEQYQAGGRAELAAQEEAQVVILETFLPPQMDEESIREIAVKKQTELGLGDKSKAGILVGAVMKEIAGRADGAVVKKIVESLFA